MKVIDKYGSKFIRALIRQMRALGLNQSQLARRMKVSRAYVSKVFSGDLCFTFANAAKFCRALEMDFNPSVAPKNPRNAPENACVRREAEVEDLARRDRKGPLKSAAEKPPRSLPLEKGRLS